MLNFGGGYRKVPFDEDDIHHLNLKHPPDLFRNKGTWLAIAVLVAVTMGIPLFFWILVTVLNKFFPVHSGYQDRLIKLFLYSLLYLAGFLIFLTINKFRSYVDFKRGYKSVGEFKVTFILNLITAKYLFLSENQIIRIDKEAPVFKAVRKHNSLKIEKTATGRLLDDIKIIG